MLNRKVIISFLCITLGYIIFVIYAFSLRVPFSFPVEIYWLSFVFVSIPSFCEVLFWKDNQKLRIFYLLSFSLMIALQYAVVDFSPLMTGSDAVADYRLTNKIISDSKWNPFDPVQWFFGTEYRFHPATNFIYSTFFMATDIPLFSIVRYLFIVKAIVVPLIVDKLFRSFFESKIAYLATLLFLSSPGAIIFPHKESFAIIFFFLALFAITRIPKNRNYLFVCFVSILTLIITHHFTTYIFLGILTSLYVAQYFLKGQKKFNISTQNFLFVWILFLAWIAFVALTIFSYHQNILNDFFFGSLFSGELSLSELLSINTLYERVIIYVGYGITLISTGLGLLYYVKDKKIRSPDFLAITAFFLPILAIATLFRFSGLTSSTLISHRAYEFGYFLIGALSAFFFIIILLQKTHIFKKSKMRLILIGPLVIMMLVGPMAGSMHPVTLSRLGNVVSYNGLALDSWISEFLVSNESIVCDRTIQLIISGYGDSKSIRSTELFYSQNLTLAEGASYMATYIYMNDFYGTNFSIFDQSPYLSNIYTNGILNMYRIDFP